MPQPPRSETHEDNKGANGAPLRARVYALLMKVFWNLSYEQLHQRLAEQSLIWSLGLETNDAPTKRTLIRWFGHARLTPMLKDIFIETTKPTRRFDTMVLGDSHDIPTRMVDNSRDRKFGPKPANYRKERPLVRQHFAVGKVSGIIYGQDTTLTSGTGSADGPHLRRLLEQTRERTATPKDAAFDKAYTGAPNFEAAERLGFDLYVREKRDEDLQSKHWPPSAQRLSTLERTQRPVYDGKYRFRSKGEGTPSRIKVRNPYIRLRRRKGDPVPVYPDLPKNVELSDLPKEVQDAVFDAATEDVGVARLNESQAIMIVANLRALNTIGHVYNQTVTFEEDVTLNPPTEWNERDVA